MENVDSFRVFTPGAINRPKYDGQSRSWAPHHFPARPEVGPRHQVVWMPCGPLLLPFGLRVRVRKIGGWVFFPSNSENIYCVTFLKRKTAENTQLALWHLVNRYVGDVSCIQNLEPKSMPFVSTITNHYVVFLAISSKYFMCYL